MTHQNVWPRNEEVEQRTARVVLTCKSVLFFSHHDEDAFFEWLEKIGSIEDSKGSRDVLYVYMKSNEIPDDDLREIIALFYRYAVDMKQLQIFLNKDNKEWFYEKPREYWYDYVFGEPKKKLRKAAR